jgi:uncharacterized protein (DUF983 family)
MTKTNIKEILSFKCPKCRKGMIFSSGITLVEECSNCGLKIRNHDTGDGAVYCVMFIVGAIITLLAFFFERAYNPPLSLHLMLWTPIILFFSIWGLKIFKTILLHAGYKHQKHLFELHND